MKDFRDVTYSLILSLLCIASCSGCSTVKSVVPGMKSDTPSGPEAGEKLHLKLPPEEALAVLQEVAPQHGWKVASTGDQFDLQGLRGKYFRLEAERFLGGPKDVGGVFFSEPSGSYVMVEKSGAGLPKELTEPFLAAVEARTKGSGGP